jgi:hypothetical protein
VNAGTEVDHCKVVKLSMAPLEVPAELVATILKYCVVFGGNPVSEICAGNVPEPTGRDPSATASDRVGLNPYSKKAVVS